MHLSAVWSPRGVDLLNDAPDGKNVSFGESCPLPRLRHGNRSSFRQFLHNRSCRSINQQGLIAAASDVKWPKDQSHLHACTTVSGGVAGNHRKRLWRWYVSANWMHFESWTTGMGSSLPNEMHRLSTKQKTSGNRWRKRLTKSVLQLKNSK